jgi:hypothetical protein
MLTGPAGDSAARLLASFLKGSSAERSEVGSKKYEMATKVRREKEEV